MGHSPVIEFEAERGLSLDQLQREDYAGQERYG